MAAQKCKKKIVNYNFWYFWMPTNPKPNLTRFNNSLDSSRPYGTLTQNPKTGDF